MKKHTAFSCCQRSPSQHLSCAHSRHRCLPTGSGKQNSQFPVRVNKLLPEAGRPVLHQEAGEEVQELEGADAAGGGQGVERSRADHEAGAHRAEPKDLDAQPPHPGVVHQGSSEIVPAAPVPAFGLFLYPSSYLQGCRHQDKDCIQCYQQSRDNALPPKMHEGAWLGAQTDTYTACINFFFFAVPGENDELKS